jgi:hypothetical protein
MLRSLPGFALAFVMALSVGCGAVDAPSRVAVFGSQPKLVA